MAIKQVVRYVLECDYCKQQTQTAENKESLLERYSSSWLLRVFRIFPIKELPNTHLCEKCKVLSYTDTMQDVI